MSPRILSKSIATRLSTSKLLALTIGLAAVSATSPRIDAAIVTLNAGDGVGTSSFGVAGNWSNAAAPSAANDYVVTTARQLRTVADGGSATFAGNSLTLGDNTTAGVFVLKNATNAVVTINNLTLNNGEIQNGGTSAGAATTVTLAGSGITLAASTAANRINNGGGGRVIIISAPVSGAGALSIIGASGSTVTLTGTNSYTGATTIATGITLNIGSGGTTGSLSSSSAITNNGGTLVFNRSDALSQGNNISGTGALTKAGAGTVTLSGNLSHTGATTLNGGTLELLGTNTHSGLMIVNAGSTLSVASIANSLGNVSGINMGGGSGNGRLLYTGTGETTNRVIGSSAGSAGSSLTIDQSGSGTLTFSANTNFTNTVSEVFTLQGSTSGNGAFSGNITTSAGGISLTKAGTNTWTLSGTNTYAGATTVGAGTLSVSTLANGGTASNIGASTNAATNLVFDGGTLQYTGATQATNRSFTINAGKIATVDVSSAAADLAFVGATGAATTGALTKSGAGTLTLTGANTFTGATAVSGGTLQLGNGTTGNDGTIANTSGVSLGTGATLAFNLFGNTSAGHSISGLGGVTKLGAGTQTLTGTLSYSGPTAINGGNLTLAGSAAIGNLSVADSAALGVKVSNAGSSVIASTNNPSLTFGTAGSTSLTLDFSSLGNPTAPVINLGTGVLTLNGIVDVSLANTSGLTTTPNNTTLVLMSYASQGGAGSFNLTTSTAGHSSFALNPTATTLYLAVSANPVTWTGALSTAWNDDTLASPKNWTLPGAVETDFISGDTVLFTNTASTFAVDLTENVAPGSVNFSNTTNAYTIGSTGGFGITSGSVTLNGSGTVTINNANTYTSPTAINAGTLALNGSLSETAITVGGSGTLTESATGVIAGAASVTTSGSTTLAGANTYSGGTTLAAGTLNVNSASALGSGTLTITGGTLDSTAAGTVVSANNAQSWNDNFAFGGSNDLDMGIGAVTLGGTGDRSVSVAGTLTVGEIKSSNQGLTKQGAGTLVVTSDGSGAAASVIGGVLHVEAGTLQINRATGNNGDFLAAGVTGGGTVTNGAGAERWLFSNAASGTFDFSGTLTNGGSGALGFNKSGASTQTLSGTNNFTGVTTVAGGTLILTGTNAGGGAVNVVGAGNTSPGILSVRNSDALGTSVVSATTRDAGIQLQGGISLPSSVAFRTSNDGGLQGTASVPYAINNVSGDNTINGTITLTSGGGFTVVQSDSGSLTLAGNVSPLLAVGGRTFILQGASTAANTVSGVLANNTNAADVLSVTKTGAGSWTLSGANTYTGATTVSTGTLNLTGSLGGTPPVGTAGTAVTVASNATFSESGTGSITGAGTLTVSGTATLAGANSYTGATTVNAGTLLVHGTISGTAKVDVTGTGTLGGTGTITPASAGKVNLLSGGKLSPGASVGTLNVALSAGGTFDLSAGVTAANSQALVFELDTVAASDQVALTGGALNIGTGVLEFDDFVFSTLGGFANDSTYTLFAGDTAIDGTLGANLTGSIGGFTGTLQFADGSTDLVLVVVPEPGTALSLLGSLSLLLGLRRRRTA